MQPISLSLPFEFNGRKYKCEINPLRKQPDAIPKTFQVTLNDVYFGIVTYTGKGWESDSSKYGLVQKIGALIHESNIVLQAS
jgi:hypothetical protein